MSLAAVVRTARDTVTADPDFYEGKLDVAYFLLSDTPERTWTSSELGKVLGIRTLDAREILAILHNGGHIVATGNGAWTRYGAR